VTYDAAGPQERGKVVISRGAFSVLVFSPERWARISLTVTHRYFDESNRKNQNQHNSPHNQTPPIAQNSILSPFKGALRISIFWRRQDAAS
jgi:hypothetical protein